MNHTFYVEENGNKVEVTILTTFKIGEDNYCAYTIPTHDLRDVQCAKIVGNTLQTIDNEQIKKIIDKILLQLENNRKEDSEEQNETFYMQDEYGNQVEAQILDIIEINNQEYVLYSTKKNEEEVNIFAKKIIKDQSGEEQLISIENPNEREIVFNTIKEILEDGEQYEF